MKNVNNNGITLIALIITIIILIILAGITITSITGSNGIFNKVTEATETYNNATNNEILIYKDLLERINQYSGNIIVTAEDITARGFKIKAELKNIDSQIEKIEYYINNEKVSENLDYYYIAESLNTDTQYTVYIKAIDKNGQIYPSNPINIKTLAILIKIEATYVGTRGYTVKALIENGENEITELEYIVDKISKYKGENREFSQNGLEPETQLEIYAKGKNIKGEIWETNKLAIKTEPKTYIYSYGNEFAEFTGGITMGIMSTNNHWQNPAYFDGNGSYSYGTYTKNSNNLRLFAQHYNSNSSYGITAVYVTTGRPLEISKFKTFAGTFSQTTNSNAYINFRIVNMDEKEEFFVSSMVPSSNQFNLPTNITEGYIRFGIESSATANTYGEIIISELWLEK